MKSSLVDIKSLQLNYAFEKGVNFGARTIIISGDIDHASFQLVDTALTEMESDSKEDITIKINSLGGSVYDALAIVGRMRASKCNINTEGYGAVMSAAALILVSGKNRTISSVAWLMSHESIYGTEGSHSEVKELVEQRDREETQWCKLMAEKTKKSEKWWKDIHKKGDIYLSAKDCLKLGVVDEIV